MSNHCWIHSFITFVNKGLVRLNLGLSLDASPQIDSTLLGTFSSLTSQYSIEAIQNSGKTINFTGKIITCYCAGDGKQRW